MRNLARKSLMYFMVFTVILWNVGTPAFAVDTEGLDKTTDRKITICHVVPETPGRASHTVTEEISESAWPTHQAHGDTLGACEQETYPVPVVDANFHSGNTSVLITWDEITHEDLDGYKVVMSETNPNPAYPGDGYIRWETDSTVTSFDYAYQYVCDQNYYFSVTALYDSHNVKVPGNAVTLNFACEQNYCDTADVVINTDLGVVGDGCYAGGDWFPVDTELVPMTLAGNYEVYAEVERSDANVQLAETFTLAVASTTGPELPDNEEVQNVIEQYAGDFYFINGNNLVTMTTTAQCPPDETPNSVKVLKLCMTALDTPDPLCGDGEVNQTWEQCDDGNLEDGDGCDAQCQIEIPEEPYLTVKAHKVVCDAEEYLPNWGDGSGPSTITATTAADYVAQNEHCWLEDNWSFQWGIGVPVMPGDHVGPATSGAWMNFNSVTNGSVPAQVDIYRNDGTIKIRENLQEGYVPFSYTPGTGQTPPGDNVSAEIYCHNDVLNYDNYDFINNPQLDYTYYCVAFNAEIEEEYDPYCGDGIVNQKWEQCDSGLTTSKTEGGGGGEIVGCSQQCQYIVPPQECSDLTLAKINVEDFRNWNGGDMTSDLFLGSESYRIPHDVWFAVYWNGNYFLDADLSNYEDVPGLAVQRLEDSLRVVMHGTGSDGEKEHVSGDISFWNANVGTLESDDSNDYPKNNKLENGFDGTGVGFYNAGNDEVWVEDGKSNYWLTTTTADDGYYTNWEIIEDCDGPSICGVKFEDIDKDGRQSDIEQNLADWTINLYEKSSCNEGDEWADEVVVYNPGPNVPSERSNPDKALGVAENNDTMNFVSLGVGGELILSFDNLIENGTGDDIQVFETSYGNPSCAAYPEYVRVYASQDGSNWTDLGSACQEGDPTFDLGVLAWAKYVKLVDESSNTPDGFDVDGVKAIHCLNVSEEPLATEVTTENGYCFNDVEPGHYMVCEEMQEGWTNSTPLCQQVMIEGEERLTKEYDQTVNVDFGNHETTQSIPYAPWCSALLGIVTGAVQTQTYNEVADLYTDDQLQVINLSDIAVMAQLYAEGNDPECYKQFEDPEDEFHWTCENLEEIDWCGGLEQGIRDSYNNTENYFGVFDLWPTNSDGSYGDGVINLSDLPRMASYLADPVDQYQCYDHYPFFECIPNTPPVITLIGDATVYINQGETYTDDGATADDAEDGDITADIVTNNSVDTSTPGIYIVTYNVSDSDGAAADEVTRTVIVQSSGGGDPICGNGILEQGEDCDGSAPEGYQCIECALVQIPPPPPVCVGSCGGGGGDWPPTISNVEGAAQCQEEIITNGITWKTSEQSVSWIMYGTDEDNLDREYRTTETSKEHSAILPGLEAGTTYYYTVKAQNEHGVSNSAGHSFATPAAELCGEVLGEKIEEEPEEPKLCEFLRPSGSKGPDADINEIFTYPDGSLIRYDCDASMGVFAIKEQMKWRIPSWQYLHDHYFGKRIYNVSWGVFSSYPDYVEDDGGLVAGVKTYADGTLLRGSDKKVYVIESGHKRHITSLDELMKYAGQEIVDVGDDVLAQY